MTISNPPKRIEITPARSFRIYRWVIIAMALFTFLVFAEPALARLRGLAWQRLSFEFAYTLSLDAHALCAFGFLFVVLYQLWSGRRALGGNLRHRTNHRRLGQVLALLAMPVFVAVGAWMTVDRAINVPAERSIIFDPYPGVIASFLVNILVFVAGYTWLGLVRARRCDILGHVDAMFLMLAVLTQVAMIRVMYIAVFLFVGSFPLSIVGMYLVTLVALMIVVVFTLACAGRLKANLRPLGVYLVASAILMAAALPQTSMLNLAPEEKARSSSSR